jgi:hypothetical protein
MFLFTQGAKLLHDLMTNGCTTDPSLWLPCELYQFYLEPYISRSSSDGLWRLAPTHLYKHALEYASTVKYRFYHGGYRMADGTTYREALQYLAVAQPLETVEIR